jgi:hypothetical protein
MLLLNFKCEDMYKDAIAKINPGRPGSGYSQVVKYV